MSVHDDIKKHPTACDPAVRWIKTLPADMTSADAWGICPYGEFMAWICAKVGVPESERWIWPQLAMEWAAMALDAAKVKHELRDCATIVDKKTARAASIAAGAYLYAATAYASAAADAYASAAADAAAKAADAAARPYNTIARAARAAADAAAKDAAARPYNTIGRSRDAREAARAAAKAADAAAYTADAYEAVAAAIHTTITDMIRKRIANPFRSVT